MSFLKKHCLEKGQFLEKKMKKILFLQQTPHLFFFFSVRLHFLKVFTVSELFFIKHVKLYKNYFWEKNVLTFFIY